MTIDGVSLRRARHSIPVAAREFSAKPLARRRCRFEYLGPNLPEAKPSFEVFQYLWRETLGIELVLVTQEVADLDSEYLHPELPDIAGWSDYGAHLDPCGFLIAIASHSAAKQRGWTDPKYDAMLPLTRASATSRVERLRKLADCEQISAACHALRAALPRRMGVHA